MSNVTIKNKKEIAAMREGGKKLAEAMKVLEGKVHTIARTKISTLDLDKLAEKLVFRTGGKPSFKGYGDGTSKPFPATLCISVNNEVVHGVPQKDKVLKNGDILKIDVGMKYKNMYLDMARTFAIGKISEKAQKLIDVTRKSLDIGIKELKAGNNLSSYSKAVQKYVERNKFSVIRRLVGHGVGYAVHEDPQVPNFYNKKYQDLELKPGMTLALEPMVNEGDYEIVLDDDGLTFKTKDGKLSAHFEDTIVITEKGAEILTRL
ncbi:methionine aminopeptidase 1 [bacterium BMS3Abin15]|nr:methionine aminopeptidase 1 [bacterium BMS3Abin15]HDZ85007.1 type I methionyl aminopeptidase [Candidatus Moranbacteria bacterium]